MELFQKIQGYAYFKEVAFLVAVLLILGAWKFCIEGMGE